jgi:hypothetical protein
MGGSGSEMGSDQILINNTMAARARFEKTYNLAPVNLARQSLSSRPLERHKMTTTTFVEEEERVLLFLLLMRTTLGDEMLKTGALFNKKTKSIYCCC